MNTSTDKNNLPFIGNETLFKEIVYNALCGIAISNKKKVVFTNRRFKEISGYSLEEFNSLTSEQRKKRTHPEDVSKLNKYLSNVLKFKNIEKPLFYRIIRKDGKLIWVERMSSMINHNGKILIISIFQDFTDHKLVSEELQGVKDHLENLVSYASSPIIEWDGDYKITRFNEAYEHITGRKASEVIGKKIDILFSKNNLEEFLKYIKITTQGVRWENVEIDIKHIDGSVRTVLWNSASIYSSDKKTRISTIAQGHDITNRIQAEKELKNAFTEIKELRDRIDAENVYLRKNVKQNNLYEGMVGNSDKIKAVVVKASQVATMDTTVLLIGETGTGKELLARGIHCASIYKNKALVTINCAAIPSSLIESELFGHEKGAFTDAQAKKIGLFEVANNSTIFLDEIAELPFETQAKLLRVIENKEIIRLGSNKPIKVKVRIIAATNQNLEKMVDEKKFRQDLFYRLNVYPILLPPLRMLKSDIRLLVEKFVRDFNTQMGKKIENIPKKIMKKLEGYTWPGNVRELRNIIERSMIQSPGSDLIVDVPNIRTESSLLHLTLKDLERNHIQKVLEAAFWKVSGKNGAAEILGINPNTLTSKIKKLDIKRPSV
jgi:PAS domain S-box-containing protein